MTKLIGYELKRLIWNRFFLIMFVIICFYGYRLLSGDIIAGIGYTAPFSGFSYGYYLAGLLPLLLTALLCFVSSFYSEKEKKVNQLTSATQFNPVQYGLIKCAAAAAGFLLLTVGAAAVSFLFYAAVFRFYHFGTFVIPIVITVLPAFLFTLGLGLLAGSISSRLLSIMIPLLILIPLLPLPAFADLYGARLFAAYPLTLPVGTDGEPEFLLPVSFLVGKLFYSIAGITTAALGLKRDAARKSGSRKDFKEGRITEKRTKRTRESR